MRLCRSTGKSLYCDYGGYRVKGSDLPGEGVHFCFFFLFFSCSEFEYEIWPHTWGVHGRMKACCISGTQPQNIKQLEHYLKTKISSVPMQKMGVLYEIVKVWRDVKNPLDRKKSIVCSKAGKIVLQDGVK